MTAPKVTQNVYYGWPESELRRLLASDQKPESVKTLVRRVLAYRERHHDDPPKRARREDAGAVFGPHWGRNHWFQVQQLATENKYVPQLSAQDIHAEFDRSLKYLNEHVAPRGYSYGWRDTQHGFEFALLTNAEWREIEAENN